MTADPIETETELELLDGLLADIGTIHRRAANQTLSEEDFRALVSRSRLRLKVLRAARLAEEAAEAAVIELTDAGAAIAAAASVGRDPEIQSLLRRIPSLMTAQQLAGHPGVRRARFYGPFAAIDGGRR